MKLKTYVENTSYQNKIKPEIQIQKIKGSNKIFWKVFELSNLFYNFNIRVSTRERVFKKAAIISKFK